MRRQPQRELRPENHHRQHHEHDQVKWDRADHDFGSRFHWTGSYRHYTEEAGILRQVDIGGVVAGDVRGVPKILSVIPRQPRFLVTGLTANFTPTFTNDVHFSWLRDWWQWNSLPRSSSPATTSARSSACDSHTSDHRR